MASTPAIIQLNDVSFSYAGQKDARALDHVSLSIAEGEFVGEGAYAQFGQLANVFYNGGPGLLVHPLWQAANAYFVSLRLEQEPRPLEKC